MFNVMHAEEQAINQKAMTNLAHKVNDCMVEAKRETDEEAKTKKVEEEQREPRIKDAVMADIDYDNDTDKKEQNPKEGVNLLRSDDKEKVKTNKVEEAQRGGRGGGRGGGQGDFRDGSPPHHRMIRRLTDEQIALVDNDGCRGGGVRDGYPSDPELTHRLARQQKRRHNGRFGKLHGRGGHRRHPIRPLTDVQSGLLDSIGFFRNCSTDHADRDQHDDKDRAPEGLKVANPNWMKMFEGLRRYKNEHGDCDVPATHDPELAHWVRRMRRKSHLGRVTTPTITNVADEVDDCKADVERKGKEEVKAIEAGKDQRESCMKDAEMADRDNDDNSNKEEQNPAEGAKLRSYDNFWIHGGRGGGRGGGQGGFRRMMRRLTDEQIAVLDKIGFFEWAGEWKNLRGRNSADETKVTRDGGSNANWMGMFERVRLNEGEKRGRCLGGGVRGGYPSDPDLARRLVRQQRRTCLSNGRGHGGKFGKLHGRGGHRRHPMRPLTDAQSAMLDSIGFFPTSTTDNSENDGVGGGKDRADSGCTDGGPCADRDHDEKDRAPEGLKVANPNWMKMFEGLRRYKNEHGDCDVPVTHDLELAHWVRRMRRKSYLGRVATVM